MCDHEKKHGTAQAERFEPMIADLGRRGRSLKIVNRKRILLEYTRWLTQEHTLAMHVSDTRDPMESIVDMYMAYLEETDGIR